METFVVRVWTPADAAAASAQPAELRGLVEHIGSKREGSFRDADELLELLRAGLKGAASAVGPRSLNDGQPAKGHREKAEGDNTESPQRA